MQCTVDFHGCWGSPVRGSLGGTTKGGFAMMTYMHVCGARSVQFVPALVEQV